MRISCLAKGYASYGASILTTAAQHLELSLKEIEPTNLTIEVVAYITHEGPPKRTLEHLLEQHNLKIPQQVLARYREKADKLEVQYSSRLRESESFGKPGGIYAVAHVFPRALDELAAAVVESLSLKPVIWDKIEVSRLIEAIEKSKASLPNSPDRILDYMRKMDEDRKSVAKIPDSIDEMEIEWAQYHPTAREVLNAPFFWSEIDEDAPHGNDTGSDLLAAFRRWDKRNPTASCEGYVDRLFNRWGLTAEKTQGRIDETELDWIRQNANIALAFAAIKLRGTCEERCASVAIRALDRRMEQLDNAPDRVLKVSLLRKVLQANAVQV